MDRTSADPFPFDVTHQTFAFLDIYLHLCHWRSWDMESDTFTVPLALFTYVAYLLIRLSTMADGWTRRLQIRVCFLHTAGKDI